MNSPGPVNSPHKWPITRKMFPFDDVIMLNQNAHSSCLINCGNRMVTNTKLSLNIDCPECLVLTDKSYKWFLMQNVNGTWITLDLGPVSVSGEMHDNVTWFCIIIESPERLFVTANPVYTQMSDHLLAYDEWWRLIPYATALWSVFFITCHLWPSFLICIYFIPGMGK